MELQSQNLQPPKSYWLHSPVIIRSIVYGAIGVIAFVLLMFFSQPNRLAHDQIDHTLVEMTRNNPSVFQGDYLWGTPKRTVLDNYYSLRFVEWVGGRISAGGGNTGGGVGSREAARWLLVPLVFFLFTIGMFELCYAITKNTLASLGVAVISNIHIPYVFVTEWGLPGPTELDPWTFVASVYPFLFLLFYYGITRKREWLIALAFLLTGVFGNLHLISWFNIVGVFSIAYIFYNVRYYFKSYVIPAEAGTQKQTEKIKRFQSFLFSFSFLDSGSKSGMTDGERSGMTMWWLVRLAGYVLLSIIAASPFLLQYFSARPEIITAFDPSNGDVWQAIREIAFHVTATGKLGMIRQWLFDYWYFIWPAVVVFLVVLWLERKKTPFFPSVGAQHVAPLQDSKSKSFLKFGILFIAATLVFNIAFSLFQLGRLHILHQLPEFNEPRGFQLMYPVFFAALAILVDRMMRQINVRFSLRARSIGIGIASIAVLGLIFVFFPKVKSFSFAQTHAPYTIDTCDAELYRVLNHELKHGDLMLVDPTYYGVIRVCTNYPIVVHNRDKATAYVHGSDVMMEWYQRFHEVQNAFAVGGDMLISAAKKYQASVIVSRQCVPIPEDQLSYSKKIPHPTLGFEGCVYRIKS